MQSSRQDRQLKVGHARTCSLLQRLVPLGLVEDPEEGQGVVHPLYQPRARPQGNHAEGAGTQAAGCGGRVSPQDCIGAAHNLHQTLIQAQVLPPLQRGHQQWSYCW